MKTKKEIISIKDLSFVYQKELILHEFSLSVIKGDFLGLIGPNGSGKTTLLKIILGLLEPTSGKVKLLSKKIGYVAQKAGFASSGFPITVEEVISMAGGKAKEIERVLELTGIASKRKRLLNELSGGQQQRVFIARALLHKPELLILDEPTVGIDSEAQNKFYELLRKLNREQGLTIILVSHDLDTVEKKVDKIINLGKR
jgi:zinc transport system ATP-binding protein